MPQDWHQHYSLLYGLYYMCVSFKLRQCTWQKACSHDSWDSGDICPRRLFLRASSFGIDDLHLAVLLCLLIPRVFPLFNRLTQRVGSVIGDV